MPAGDAHPVDESPAIRTVGEQAISRFPNRPRDTAAFMFAFLPLEIRVPRGRDVTFRMTSPDVIHGFQIVQTNGNTMVVPGRVSQFTTLAARRP